MEMRSKHWLQQDYFQCLAKHGVAHVFNSRAAMPPVSEQIACAATEQSPALTAARFLWLPGRKCEDSVKLFEPYDRVQEPNDDARAAGANLIAKGKSEAEEKKTMIYVGVGLKAMRSKRLTRCWKELRPQESSGTSNS